MKFIYTKKEKMNLSYLTYWVRLLMLEEGLFIYLFIIPK